MSAAKIAEKLGGAKRQANGGWLTRCCCHEDHDPSLSLRDGDNGTLLVTCFANCASTDILRELRRRGLLDDRPEPSFRPMAIKATDRSKLDWLLPQLRPIEGTVVETYLRECRGVDPPTDGHHLRYLPAKPPKFPWPCMVGIITDFTDAKRVLSLHFTRLEPDGSDKAPLPKSQQRSFLAGLPIKGGVIRLCDDADITLRIGVAEGIETALAVTTAFRRDKGRFEPVWAALSATNLAYLPVLPNFETFIAYGDHGQAGETAAKTVATRWVNAGRQAFICIAPVDDWNPEIAP
jgi:putative DNA primase/helicase